MAGSPLREPSHWRTYTLDQGIVVTRTAADALSATRDGAAWEGPLALDDFGHLTVALPDGRTGVFAPDRTWVLTRASASLYRVFSASVFGRRRLRC